jgi:hypothetical protein
LLVLLVECRAARGAETESRPERVTAGLQVVYEFGSYQGPLVTDQAGRDEPLPLKIADVQAVRQSAGELEIASPTLIRSEAPARRLSDALQQAGSLTVEAWVRPASATQNGPARIVTLSRSPNERNLTIGQDGDKIEVRLRTTQTSANGMPAVVSKPKSLGTEWTHIVYTFDRAGRARLYVNGQLNNEQAIGGSLSNWDGGHSLALGNELTGDRPWLGSIRLVAIYSRDLTASEVGQNFQAGARTTPPSAEEQLARRERASAALFEMQIAPLLSKHCLECHDTVTREGNLDLSRKSAALAGGDSGPVLVRGTAAGSELWRRVAADEMPHDRPPLSAEQKAVLRQWLDGGAVWSLDFIDSAVYVQGEGSQQVFVQRLTVPEYIETVRGVLGVDIAREARELLPRDLRADGFSNTAYNLTVDFGHVEAYAKLAELIAGRIDVKKLAAGHTNSRELTDENVTKVVEPVGRRLLRGPLSKVEIATYCGISTSVAGAGGNFDEALRYILEGMLQSPRFIYRVERQPSDGIARPLDPHELASRVSYIIWGGPPDDALLQAADKKSLDRAGVEAQAKRMLGDRRAIERSRQFLAEWLNLGRLANLRPNPGHFPDWDARLAADMREETLAFFEEVAWKQNRPLSHLLNAPLTFVTPRLARHYGLVVDPTTDDDKPIRCDLSNVPGRGGLLTQGSVLTVGGDGASMVARGLFIMHELLRGVVRDPPPCVDTTPVASKPGLTQRLVSEQRIANKSCTGCHAKFEPLAFGLEKFDGLGSFHETDQHGNRLRDDGRVLFPGEEKPVAYGSSRELMDLLADSDRVRESFTWKVTQFALGRPLGARDVAAVADIHRRALQSGGTYAGLITAIVTSDLVMQSRAETAQ